MTTRRKFITTGAIGAAAAAVAAPVSAQTPIKWRMQTYAGAALGAEVVKPAIDAFNLIAQGQMEIELYYADQLVPTSELSRALQNGTIDAVQSDDDSMASPTEVTVFGGYFPLALRYSLDVPALFNH
jgi:TRAP-type C4-dicarboxylate transport system substrate-binding protein